MNIVNETAADQMMANRDEPDAMPPGDEVDGAGAFADGVNPGAEDDEDEDDDDQDEEDDADEDDEDDEEDEEDDSEDEDDAEEAEGTK